VTALKDYRTDLAAHLATELEAAAAKLGAQVNPAAIVVRPAAEYVAVLDYCTDNITFEAVIVPASGDLPAEVDALDDMIDLVRPALRSPSLAGHKYRLIGISGHGTYQVAGKDHPAVIATIGIERYLA
jgi:hypothetical protein